MTRAASGRWLLILPLAVLLLSADGRGDEAPPQFSPEVWRQTPQTGGRSWSREALLHQFAAATEVRGKARSEMIALLGEPGYSAAIYYPGSGQTGRIDIYRLSAANERSYHIDYDADEKVSGAWQETISCGCDLCRGELPSVPFAVLDATILKKDAARAGKGIAVAEFERLLGRPGKQSIVQSPAGGQMWVNYDELWAVAGKEHRFLIASGHRPLRDWRTGPLDNELFESFDLVALTAECLAP